MECKACGGTGIMNMCKYDEEKKPKCIYCNGTGKSDSVELTEEEVNIYSIAKINNEVLFIKYGVENLLNDRLAKQKAELEPIIKAQVKANILAKLPKENKSKLQDTYGNWYVNETEVKRIVEELK